MQNYQKVGVAVALALLFSNVVVARQLKTEEMKHQEMTTRDLRDQHSINSARNFQMSELDRVQTGMVTLPKAREKLALEWQKLGVPEAQAKVIASAFRADMANMLNHPPLKGKSNAEVSAMIQDALNSKNYRMANQLLIDFERAQLSMEPMTAEAPMHH